jgi:hypothetical protein
LEVGGGFSPRGRAAPHLNPLPAERGEEALEL